MGSNGQILSEYHLRDYKNDMVSIFAEKIHAERYARHRLRHVYNKTVNRKTMLSHFKISKERPSAANNVIYVLIDHMNETEKEYADYGEAFTEMRRRAEDYRSKSELAVNNI